MKTLKAELNKNTITCNTHGDEDEYVQGFVRKLEGNRPLGRRRYEDASKKDHRENR
jgi:hypothetical protein